MCRWTGKVTPSHTSKFAQQNTAGERALLFKQPKVQLNGLVDVLCKHSALHNPPRALEDLGGVLAIAIDASPSAAAIYYDPTWAHRCLDSCNVLCICATMQFDASLASCWPAMFWTGTRSPRILAPKNVVR